MFLYVDDIRTPMSDDWVIARNYKDAIDLIKNNNINIISLDHDLGEAKSGYDIAKFLVENSIKIEQINIHTANPVGRDNIKQLIEHYFPDTIVTTCNKI